MLKYVNYTILFFLTFIVDRVTKYLVISEYIESQAVTDFFNIFVTFNRGIAWGIGSELPTVYTFFLYTFIGIVLLYFMYYLKNVLHNKMLAVASTLILSGGISNFIDRIWYGSVIDFIQLHYHSWYFPVFNVADIAITCGALFLLVHIFLYPEQ